MGFPMKFCAGRGNMEFFFYAVDPMELYQG